MAQNDRISKLIIKSIEDELTEEEAIALDTWAKTSPENLVLLNQLQDQKHLLALVYEYDKTQKDIRKEVKKPVRAVTFVRKYWWAAAAVLTAAILYGVINSLPTGRSSDLLHLATKIGESKTFALPDDSRVILNGETSLSYPAVFTGDERKVFITGEALFEVKKDKRSFIVEVSASTPLHIKSNESRFNLMSYSDSPSVITSVLTGEAEVISKYDKILASANKEVVTDSTGKSYKQDFDSTERLSWRYDTVWEGSHKISETLAKMGKWYGYEVVYPNRQSIDTILSMMMVETIEKRNGLQPVLDKLKHINLRGEIRGQKLIITHSQIPNR